ncbi:MAG TPA: alpha/beta fold hydrolase [Kofleriaceae bacterium]
MSNVSSRRVVIPAINVSLIGDLSVPRNPIGVVLFAHGSGSSRRSPRNRQVAIALEQRGLATLLFDLLTEEEDRIDRLDASLRFNIGLLAERLIAATDWIREQPAGSQRIGYFGASTGAAAALIAAARRPELVAAVVSRGGRPDLAGPALAEVHAPTMLIVGGEDPEVIQLNEVAMAGLTVPAELVIVPGATHLFEEPGTLETVAELAADWFVEHLARPTAAEAPAVHA